MTELRKFRPQQDYRMAFFQGFLRRPGQVASIIPSSRFLERRIVRFAEVQRARLIVELGPGTGGTTRALLRAMAPEAQLVSIEINPDFIPLLQRIRDERLIVAEGSATQLVAILHKHGLRTPDLVLSGIPFSTMPRPIGLQILIAAQEALAPGGRFVAYQVRDRVELLGRQVFGRPRIQTELLNVPPMRLYRWDL